MIKAITFKHINLCDIYVILWAYYQYADMYVHSSIALLGSLFPMMLISLYYFYQTVADYPIKGYIKSLVFFLIFLSIYGVLHWAGGEYVGDAKPSSFLFGNWNSMAPILVFYIGTLKRQVNDKRMFLYFILFMVIAVLRYEHNYVTRDLEVEELYLNGGFTNNASYFFASLLPFVFFFDRKYLLKYAILLICIYFVLNGMKRGALLITGLFLCFYLWTLVFRDSSGNRVGKIFSILLLIVVTIAIYFFVNNSWLYNEYVIERLQSISEGDTNGRADIYRILLNNFVNNTNLFNMFFGIGPEGTMRVAQLHAHNDWLELLTDCGIVGVLFYLSYFYSFFKTCKKYKNILPEGNIIFSCMLLLLVKSFFSMSFMNMFIGISCVLGYGLAKCQQKMTEAST